MNNSQTSLLALAASTVLLGGCAATAPVDDVAQLKQQLQQVEARNSNLTASQSTLEQTLSERELALRAMQERLQGAEAMGSSLLPPKAQPGQCYARVFSPPVYETITQEVLHSEASEKLAARVPEYRPTEERVLVKEASTRLEVIPARYDWVEERVLVKEASEEMVVEPAVYRSVEEQILVRPAYSHWKKGRGPIEKINDMTGEIMCLVEVPAEYKTVVKHVLATPAATRTIAIPAEYTIVKKRVMVEGPKSVEVEIPAEYKTVRVNKLAAGPSVARTPVPAKFQTLSAEKLVREGRLEWQQILCETNTTPDVIRKLQAALKSTGYNPGPIDGVLGSDTTRALNAYQRDKGLPSGRLTLESLRELGVMSTS